MWVVVGLSWRTVLTWESSCSQGFRKGGGLRVGRKPRNHSRMHSCVRLGMGPYQEAHELYLLLPGQQVLKISYRVRISHRGYGKMHIYSLRSKFLIRSVECTQNLPFYSKSPRCFICRWLVHHSLRNTVLGMWARS